MPSIKIQRESSLKGPEVFERLAKLLNEDKELRKLDPDYVCNFETAKMTGNAKSKLFTASLSVNETGGKSKMELVVDLPFHLALVKGVVQKTLEKKLDAILPS